MDQYKQSHALLIQRLVGRDSLPIDDPYWLELLRFERGHLTARPAALLTFLQPYLGQFAVNNPLSGNFSVLVTHTVEFLGRASAPSASAADVQHGCNATALLSAVAANFLSVTPPQDVAALFSGPSVASLRTDALGQIVDACLDIVCLDAHEGPKYTLLVACLALLLTLCSSQAYFLDASAPGTTPAPSSD